MLAVVLAVPLAGCGSIQNLIDGPHVYGGVRTDLTYIEPGDNMESGTIAMFDLPLSFVLDTGLLPATLISEVLRLITGWPPPSARLYPPPAPEVRKPKWR